MAATHRCERTLRILAIPLILAAPAGSVAAAVTYSAEVRTILERHCVGCHHGAAGTSVALATFEEARQHGAQMLAAIDNGSMPPWPVDTARSARMRNDPRLSAAESEALRHWVNAGMPPGDSPAQSARSSEWTDVLQRAPDEVVSLPPISVPASGEIPYVRMLIKVPLDTDRWIAALQPLPGDPAVVHHMGIAEVSLPAGIGPAQVQQLQEVAAKLGLRGRSLVEATPAVADPTSIGTYDMLAAYTPGDGFESYPPGTGKLLRGGGNYYINFNIHYTTTGTATTDTSRIGLWFLKAPPQRQLIRTPVPGHTLIAEGRELFPDDPGSKAEGTDVAIPPIPPNADNYELIGVTAFERPVTLYSFQPHAHLRGKDFLYEVVYPDGRTRTLLSIPHYDYHMQLHYELAEPVDLPAGAKLVVTAHYDNSPANKSLREMAAKDLSGRCGPDKYAFFRSQNQTWDEMFSPLVQYGVRLQNKRDADRRAALPLVVVEGCLIADDGPRWYLRRANTAQPTQTAAVSRAEFAAATPTSGAASYLLIGASPFRPNSKVAQHVLVKGVRISQRPIDAINVTAVQDLGSACER